MKGFHGLLASSRRKTIAMPGQSNCLARDEHGEKRPGRDCEKRRCAEFTDAMEGFVVTRTCRPVDIASTCLDEPGVPVRLTLTRVPENGRSGETMHQNLKRGCDSRPATSCCTK